MPKGKKKHSLEKQSNKQKPDSGITEMLKLSDKEFKRTMLRALVEKVENLQEQMGNFNRQVGTLRIKRKC